MGFFPPLIGKPYNGYINPYYWVDDHPILWSEIRTVNEIRCESPLGFVPGMTFPLDIIWRSWEFRPIIQSQSWQTAWIKPCLYTCISKPSFWSWFSELYGFWVRKISRSNTLWLLIGREMIQQDPNDFEPWHILQILFKISHQDFLRSSSEIKGFNKTLIFTAYIAVCLKHSRCFSRNRDLETSWILEVRFFSKMSLPVALIPLPFTNGIFLRGCWVLHDIYHGGEVLNIL